MANWFYEIGKYRVYMLTEDERQQIIEFGPSRLTSSAKNRLILKAIGNYVSTVHPDLVYPKSPTMLNWSDMRLGL